MKKLEFPKITQQTTRKLDKMSTENFLSLGRQPLANAYLKNLDQNQKFYDLSVSFNTEDYMVNLEKFVPTREMFTEEYAYHSSTSLTMIEYFKILSEHFKKNFKTNNVLEIGSNDGIFSKNFLKSNIVCLEPCKNLAKITESMGYTTYNKYWTLETSKDLLKKHEKFDLIYSANCISHIPDLSDVMHASHNALSDNGVFVFEDPSLLEMIKRVSYDQIYDEHSYMFSILSLDAFLKKHGFEIFKVEKTKVHGGGNRVYAQKLGEKRKICNSVHNAIQEEKEFGLTNIETYRDFSKKVIASKRQLLKTINTLKKEGKKIISYGSTAKSVTVFNYCGIDSRHIDYVVDVTEFKQGKFLPGVKIPVVKYEKIEDDVDVVFLGAWNFSDEILKKESEFLKRGGKFLTHIESIKNKNEEFFL